MLAEVVIVEPSPLLELMVALIFSALLLGVSFLRGQFRTLNPSTTQNSFKIQGKATHPQNQIKNSLHKQFAQTHSAWFLHILKGKRGQFVQTVPKSFVQTVL